MSQRRLALILTMIVFAAGCGVRPVRIEGTAMLPALADGDKVLMTTELSELKRGDIVMHRFPKDPSKFYVKRIIGLPGEKLEIRRGEVFVNDQPIDEPYVDPELNDRRVDYAPKTIETNSFFLLGDNRDNSSDSRSWGTVNRDLITGKYSSTYSRAAKK